MKTTLDQLSPAIRGMLWATATGVIFTVLNTFLRQLAQQLDPTQTQFLRYSLGVVVMAPWVLSSGFAAFRPNNLRGQLIRGGVHTLGLLTWFAALPHIPLADSAAIGFTVPIFVMIGAAWFLGERMAGVRWLAAIIAFGGVIIVLAPKLAGSGGLYNLVMLVAQPLLAASLLINKVLTRSDRVEVIVVWQAMLVGLFTLPFALAHWQWPSGAQWALFVLCGILGTAGQYCNGRALRVADASATQSVKFLELVWATAIGLVVFGDPPSQATIIGGLVIVAATVWVARHEARR